MENKKVKINEHVVDLVELSCIEMTLRNALYRLEDLVEETGDSLLKDIAEHLSNKIDTHIEQLLGYIEDNYEFVKEEK